jgi:hypothetical protein
MEQSAINHWMWLFWIYFVRISCLFFQLCPSVLPKNERKKILDAAIYSDVVIVFNPGGWGDAPLERAGDFTPILDGIQQAIDRLGYRSTVVQYTRTLSSLVGRMAGIKDQLNSFKNGSRIQAEEMKYLSATFPEKIFFLAGFSTGGGLTGRTIEKITSLPNIYGIQVGVPGWFYTHKSERSIVLNNSNQDPISVGDVNAIARSVFKTPLIWLKAKVKGWDLSFPLALQMPHHEYSWSSPGVSAPIVKFIEANFKRKSAL